MFCNDIFRYILSFLNLFEVVPMREVSHQFRYLIDFSPHWEEHHKKYSQTQCKAIAGTWENYLSCLQKNCVCIAKERYPEYFVAKEIQKVSNGVHTPALSFLLKRFDIRLDNLPIRFLDVAFEKGAYALTLTNILPNQALSNIEVLKEIEIQDPAPYFCHAIRKAHYEIFAYLLDRFPDYNEASTICARRDIKLLNEICSRGYVNTPDDIPLEIYVMDKGNKYRSSPSDFFDAGMKWNIFSDASKLVIACYLGRYSLVEELCENAAVPFDTATIYRAIQVTTCPKIFNFIGGWNLLKMQGDRNLLYVADNVWVFKLMVSDLVAYYEGYFHSAFINNAEKILRYILETVPISDEELIEIVDGIIPFVYQTPALHVIIERIASFNQFAAFATHLTPAIEETEDFERILSKITSVATLDEIQSRINIFDRKKRYELVECINARKRAL